MKKVQQNSSIIYWKVYKMLPDLEENKMRILMRTHF